MALPRRIAVLVLLVLTTVLGGSCFAGMVQMPGTSWSGALGTPRPELTQALRDDVTHLAGTIGERNLDREPGHLEQAGVWLEQRLTALGYDVKKEPFTVGERTVVNLIVEQTGTSAPKELVVVGAHYDSAPGTPGADDNASGVAVALALAAHVKTRSPARTVRFVFFTNEEPPWFETVSMGSEVHAKATRARNDDVKVMLSLETLGLFTDEANSQHYPWPFSLAYPSTGNFVAFVADTDSRELVRESVKVFREVARVPSEGASVPSFIEGVDWSDHGPFWRQNYRAFMVTDTAPFRNPHYHQRSDTPDRLDYARLALVTEGLFAVVEHLSRPGGYAPRP
jgi:hypothetical protein